MIKKFGWLWGFLFMLGGILGFVPGITKDEMFLGFFMVNTPHNIMHILTGVVFVVATISGARAARFWFLIFGGFYLALAIIGFAVGNGLIFNLLSSSLIDSWGHAFLGAVLFLTGLPSPKPACAGGTRCGCGKIDKEQFGPWAVVTGASSGLGREFADQIASAGINLVLVARREELLKEIGAELSKTHGIEHRVVAVDLAEDGFMDKLGTATAGLDVGLVVSNAGTASSGRFVTKNIEEMEKLLRLNTWSHLRLAHHFAPKLCARKRGGLLFVGAMGSEIGVPYMVNDAASKAYVRSFARGLHAELAESGVHVTVLPPGPTETPALEKIGLKPEKMPMKPMSAWQCVTEGLCGLSANRAVIIPGRLNRIMNTVVPASVRRRMIGKMFMKAEG